MMPQRAYVLLPRQMVSTLRGMRKYSIVRASAKLLGGMMQLSHSKSTKLFSSKFFGCAADVVAVAAGAVADDLAALHLAHLARLEGFDHSVLGRHAADPLVALDAHG